MTRCLNILICTLASFLLAAGPVFGKELEDRKWIEVSTEHFRIRSTLSERKTIRLIRNLDLLRLTVPIITNVARTESTIPTHIYAVKNSGDFQRFGIDRNTVGRFISGLRNNTILIRDTSNMDETAIVLHEYVHFLLRNHSGYEYPRWYNEGYAEYLSGTGIRRGSFQVGRPPEHRMYGLQYNNWLAAEKLLDPDAYRNLTPSGVGMFYAQSWLLVHFLMNRTDRDSRFADDMRRYLDLTRSGADEVEAFGTAFGVSGDSLIRDLKRYLERSCCMVYNVKIDAIQPEFNTEVRRLSKPEISLGLAQTAAELGKHDVARHWYEIAVTDDATRPWAEAGLGDLLKFADEFDAARPHFETAVGLAPNDAYIQLDLAEFWFDKIKTTQFESEREAYINRARSGFVKAWKIDDTMPETYYMYGQTYLLEGTNPDKAIEMFLEAARLHPSSVQIRGSLAEAYAMAGQKDDAIAVAQAILHWGHNENRAARYARALIARLQNDKSTDSESTGTAEY